MGTLYTDPVADSIQQTKSEVKSKAEEYRKNAGEKARELYEKSKEQAERRVRGERIRVDTEDGKERRVSSVDKSGQ